MPHARANQLHRHINLFPLPDRACDSVPERLSPVQHCMNMHSMAVVFGSNAYTLTALEDEYATASTSSMGFLDTGTVLVGGS